MSKFKVGDRVKCVRNHSVEDELDIGKEYTVTFASNDGVAVREGAKYWDYIDTRFELVAETGQNPDKSRQEPPAFKVGDKVRCVKEYPYWLTKGNIYKVTHDSTGSVQRTVCVDGDNGMNGGFDADHFELAESEPEQPKYRPFGPADADPTIEQSVQSTIDRSMLIYNYLDAKRDFEAASTAYNEACQAIRDKLKDGERFVYTRYSEAYIVQRDKDGFTVERIDMV